MHPLRLTPVPLRRARRSRLAAIAVVLAALAAGCAQLDKLDNGAAPADTGSIPGPAGGQPAATTPVDPAAPAVVSNGRVLSAAAQDRQCDNRILSCQVTVSPGALPRTQLLYSLSPGATWTGSIERQQQCVDGSGAVHGEAVRAEVSAEIIAADGAGNLLMEAVVTDVIVSDPNVDRTYVLEFPLGAKTNALYSNQGLTLRPVRPPTYAAALITPLPPDPIGIGGQWEVRTPAQGLDGVQQLELVENTAEGFTVHGITGDWLDQTRSTQRITGSNITQGRLDAVGPVHRTIVVGQGVGCFAGDPTGPVRYVVAEDPEPAPATELTSTG